jgi:hypothetical protein
MKKFNARLGRMVTYNHYPVKKIRYRENQS